MNDCNYPGQPTDCTGNPIIDNDDFIIDENGKKQYKPSKDWKNFSAHKWEFDPWYDEKADYNTNAKSFYDYLARINKFLGGLVADINHLLKNEHVPATISITPNNDFIKVSASGCDNQTFVFEMEKLIKTIEDLLKRVADLESRMTVVESEIVEINKIIKEILNRLNKLENDLANLTKRVEVNEKNIEANRKNIVLLGERVTTNEKNIEANRKAIEQLQQKVSDLEKRVATNEKNIETNRKAIEQLQQKVSDLEKRVASLEADVKKLNKLIVNLTSSGGWVGDDIRPGYSIAWGNINSNSNTREANKDGIFTHPGHRENDLLAGL